MPFFSDLRAMIFAGIAALCLVIAVVQSVKLDGFLWFDGVRDKLEKCERDRNELRAGVAEAKRKNDEQVARIEKEQQEITDDIEARYKADRERMRVELDKRLRSKAPQGNPASPQAGPDGNAPGKPDEAPPVCIPTSQYVQGAETELQLDALITWVEEQLRVKR